MSSRIFQSVILQMKDASTRCIGVADEQGTVIASSDLSMMGYQISELHVFAAEAGADIFVADGKICRLIGSTDGSGYYAFVEGQDELARGLCALAAVALNEAKAGYDERHNTGTLVKNILMDNILPGDVYVRAKELHFATDTPRAVMIVRQGQEPELLLTDYLVGHFTAHDKDFVLSMSETDVVIIRDMTDHDFSEIESIALELQKNIQADLGITCTVGLASPVRHLRELADRYKEAQTALDVGAVFEPEKVVVSYENLGIGRIIYQLPTTLCEMFLAEVFKKNPIESLDQETLYTISKFFENNLNVSETSRKLFVHRNTLVYRLEKIKKLTGLDLREFDHAIIFKVALMVKRYLETQNTRY